MKTKLFFVWLLIIYNQANAQQSSQAFLESYGATGTQELFYKTSVIRGSDGYTYLSGATLNSNGNYDMLLSKMDSHNQVIWTQQYAGSAGGDDFAADLIQDGAGNIIITGTQYVSATNYNAVTIKYNSSGVQQWIQTFNGAANSYDGGIALARDASNNIYVCGGSYGITTLSDFLCIKYNSSGTQQWATTWNSVGLQDVSARIAVSGTQVSVIGAAQQSTIDWKMASTFFNVNTGAFMGAKLTGGDDEGIDKVADLAIDANDNTYIVGSVRNINHEYDLKVIKLSSSYTTLWQQTYNGAANLNDEGLSLELTASNDVIVCGSTENATEGKNFLTLRYSGTTGGLMWTKIYDAQGGEDIATDLKLDAGDNPIICGSSYKDGNIDYVVQKMKNTSGAIYWTGRWNSDFNLNDKPMNLVIDEDNNTVFVAGQSEVVENGYKYVVTKWSQKDVFMPKPVDGFSSSGGYIQNREQLRNVDGSANTNVRFYCQKNSPSTYVGDSIISYQLTNITEDTTDYDIIHRVDMKFNKGNGGSKVYPLNPRPEYGNYYLGHMSAKAERTGVYNTIIKPSVYANTDIIFSNSQWGYRNWIIARSGAPVSLFEMQYDGQTSLSIDNTGALIIETTIGNIIQPKAKAYTLNHSTGVLTLLNWQPNYVLNNNIVSFSNFGNWTGTLVIELTDQPQTLGSMVAIGNLDWSTFTGGTGFDQSLDVTSDENENAWSVGEEANEPFAETPGNISIGGSFILLGDAFISKFNSDCEMSYFTAYGGNNSDRCYSVASTESGELFAVGYTESENVINYVLEGSLDDPTLNGLSDGFILKLNAQGTIILDSYIGGDGIDFCSGVAYQLNTNNGQRDVWICGNGTNPNNFPTQTFGSYNQPHAGGADGFVMRLVGPTHNLQWCTWYGSENDDYINDIAIVTSDPIFIGITETTGYSSSTCGIPSDGKFPNCNNAGSSWQWPWTDAGSNLGNYFMGRFSDQNLSLRWSTFLGAAPDYIISANKAGIAASSEGFTEESMGLVFVTGSVPSIAAESFPLVNPNPSGYNQLEFGGGNQDIFLSRFRVVGNTSDLTWSTFIGGENDENGFGLAIDGDERMFLTGYTKSANLQNPGNWCTVPADSTFPICNENGLNYMEIDMIGGISQRTIIMAFDLNTKLLWSSQFGNGEYNNGKSVSVGNNKLFLVGHSEESWTDLDYDPSSSSDYFQPTLSQYRDGTIARFDIPTIVGIDEQTNVGFESLISVFPNPSSSVITIKLNADDKTEKYIYLHNSIGQLVNRIPIKNGVSEIQLDISNYSNGVYKVTLFGSTQNSTCTFLKN